MLVGIYAIRKGHFREALVVVQRRHASVGNYRHERGRVLQIDLYYELV